MDVYNKPWRWRCVRVISTCQISYPGMLSYTQRSSLGKSNSSITYSLAYTHTYILIYIVITRRGIWTHNTSLIPPLCIEKTVMYLCVVCIDFCFRFYDISIRFLNFSDGVIDFWGKTSLWHPHPFFCFFKLILK